MRFQIGFGEGKGSFAFKVGKGIVRLLFVLV